MSPEPTVTLAPPPSTGLGARVGKRYRAKDARAERLGLISPGSALGSVSAQAYDAFVNAAARMGWGTPSVAEGADYQMVRTSFDYWLLVTLYRNHWISRRIVDAPAKDMVRAWPKLTSELPPEDLTTIDRAFRKTGTKRKLLKALKFGRLFGGAAALIIIDGDEDRLDQPLKLDEIEVGSYRGLIPFDRWVGIAPAGEVCTDINRPNAFDLPEFYNVQQPSVNTFRVHASRILRFCGPDVPAPEYQAQQYWGISVLEPVYEALRMLDNVSWNVLSLTFRASILAMKWKDMAQALSGAGTSVAASQQFYQRMQAVNHLLSNQNLMVVPEDGGIESITASFASLPEVIQQFQLNISGAAEMPITRLFGRTITGLGQSNDADERLYEERIATEQDENLRPELERLFAVVSMSELGEVPDDLDFSWPSVRVLTEEEKTKLATDSTANVVALVNAGLWRKSDGLRELKQQSDVTGFATNITDEMIEQAEKDEESGLGEMGETIEQLLAPRGGKEGGAPADGGTPATKAATGRADDSDFEESKHPRSKSGSEAGQFTAKGGGGGGSSNSSTGTAALAPASADRAAWPKHIQDLKLPPAWRDVKISGDPDADLQATGKDAKGRLQYVYSKRFQNSQAEAKFARIKELDSKFPEIQRQNSAKLKSADEKERQHAECIQLIMEMGIRPGSKADRKVSAQAYGATTLQGRHVVQRGDKMYLQFTGKKGVNLKLPIPGSVAKVLAERAKAAGPNGQLFPDISENTLLEYTHSFDGGGFKTKDFRTRLGTSVALEQVQAIKPPTNPKEYKKSVFAVAKVVSEKLGNTPTVALQSYISPTVFADWKAYAAA